MAGLAANCRGSVAFGRGNGAYGACSTSAQVITSLPIATGASQHGGYLTWASSAIVDGNTRTVVTTASGNITGDDNLIATFVAAKTGTVVSTNAVRAVVYSFQSPVNPTTVVWDPSAGFGAEAELGSGASGVRSTGATVVVAVLVAVLAAVAVWL